MKKQFKHKKSDDICAPSQDWSVESGYSFKSRINLIRAYFTYSKIARSASYIGFQWTLVFVLIVSLVGFFIWSTAYIAIISPIDSTKDVLSASRASETWSVTTALILSVKTERHASRHGTSYCHRVIYKYQANNVEYIGNRINFGYQCTSTSWAPVNEGEKVRAHYNPTNPKESALDVSVPIDRLVASIFFAVLFTVSIFLYIWKFQ